MADYIVIPAAPGTVLMVASVDKKRGAKPRILESPVIAWRIPKQPSTSEQPIAVSLGYPEEPFDRPSEDHVRSVYGDFSIIGFLTPDGMVSCRLNVSTKDQFIEQASADLLSYLDDHFGHFETLPFRFNVKKMPTKLPTTDDDG